MELGDGVLAKPTHVLAYGEGEVIAVDLLLEDNLVAKRLTEPGNISRRG